MRMLAGNGLAKVQSILNKGTKKPIFFVSNSTAEPTKHLKTKLENVSIPSSLRLNIILTFQ